MVLVGGSLEAVVVGGIPGSYDITDISQYLVCMTHA